MLKLTNQEYWARRADRVASQIYGIAEKDYVKIERMFKRATTEINKDVRNLYAKHAVMQEKPIYKKLSDGTRVIAGQREMMALKKSIKTDRAMKRTQKRVSEILMSLSHAQNAQMKETLRKLATNSFNRNMFEIQQRVGYGVSFNVLTDTQINAILKNKTFGRDFSGSVWENRRRLGIQTNRILQSGLTQGFSTQTMTMLLQNKMKSGYKVAERLMRTEITSIYNQADVKAYEESGIVEQFQFVATLDERTSEQCQELDGKIFKVADSIVGVNTPPIHPNCRSTTVPYFDDKYIQERIARDKTGDTFIVPSNMTYKEYAKKYLHRKY